MRQLGVLLARSLTLPPSTPALPHFVFCPNEEKKKK